MFYCLQHVPGTHSPVFLIYTTRIIAIADWLHFVHASLIIFSITSQVLERFWAIGWMKPIHKPWYLLTRRIIELPVGDRNVANPIHFTQISSSVKSRDIIWPEVRKPTTNPSGHPSLFRLQCGCNWDIRIGFHLPLSLQDVALMWYFGMCLCLGQGFGHCTNLKNTGNQWLIAI